MQQDTKFAYPSGTVDELTGNNRWDSNGYWVIVNHSLFTDLGTRKLE